MKIFFSKFFRNEIKSNENFPDYSLVYDYCGNFVWHPYLGICSVISYVYNHLIKISVSLDNNWHYYKVDILREDNNDVHG